jgi:hypothetical protein
MRLSRIFIGIAVLLTFVASGCAHKGPILVDFMYQPQKGAAPEAAKVTVGVSPFKDDRGKSDSVVGSRFHELSNSRNDLVVQGNAADRVTKAVKEALRDRSITERDAAAWDLTEANIPASGTDLVVGGEIKSLWVDAEAKLGKTTVTAEVQLRVAVADTAQKKIVRILNLNSKLERQTAVASFAFVGKTLSEALTSAVDQIFADEELKKILK